MMLRNAAGRRAVATAATAVSLALALTACGGTTKDSKESGGAKAAAPRRPTRTPR